ncbi:hypothetical protein Syun_015681 [Stephania yunnanensis]|uniref:Uncharacterized protein n=1 Tax=Stephania yunnanensis TaxID=152371 RepID=A0AAP0JMN4_9MAGN
MAVRDNTASDDQEQQISRAHHDHDHDHDEIDQNALRNAIEEQEHQTNNNNDDDDDESSVSSESLQKHHITSIDATLFTRLIPSRGLSFQLWPAAAALVNLLDRHVADPTTSPISNFLAGRPNRSLRILELGSGTGMVGIAAAAMLGANVTVTDLPHVLSNLRFNAEQNGKVISLRGGFVSVEALRWGEVEDVEGLMVDGPFDLVLGSDVVYYEELFEPLMKTLCWLLLGGRGRGGGGSSGGVFLMAHLKRWKKESGFFRKARKVFSVEKVHTDAPLQGARNGVVVYSFASKK